MAVRILNLERPDTCGECGEEMPIGTEVRYYSLEKIYHNPSCRKPAPVVDGIKPAKGGALYPLDLIQALEGIRVAIESNGAVLRELLANGKA